MRTKIDNRLKVHFIVDMDKSSVDFCPHLGVAYLSAYLKKYFNNVAVSLSYHSSDICSDIETIKPDILAFSSTSRHFLELRDISTLLKKRYNLPTVWGGVHLTISPHELPESADIGVLGEGEQTVYEIISDFDGRQFNGLHRIKGIAYRKDGKIVINEKRSFIERLDDLPYPDYELFNVRWGKSKRAALVSSRGCPYKCRFCASSKFWDRTRLHSAEYVIGQIRHLASTYNVAEILIYDDFFTIDKQRIAEMVKFKKRYSELKKIRYECLSRIDNFDENLARDLKELGVYRISFGIESGCQKTLNYLKNGRLQLKQIERAIQIAKAHGFEAVGSFIIGSPYETAEEIKETFAFIQKLGLKAVQITIATPFPGTALWEDGKKLGKIAGDAWSDDYYTMFAIHPDLPDPVDLIQGKALMTRIERTVFENLIRKSVDLQYKINFTYLFWMKYYTAKILTKLRLGFILTLYRKLIVH